MRPANFAHALAVAVCSMCIMLGAAQAQDTPAPALKLKFERLPLNSIPPIYRAYVTAESGKFTFVLPRGFRVKDDSGAKLTFANLEGNFQITFSILDSTPSDSQPLNTDAYRDVVQARYPRGKIIEELCPAAAGRIGVGFDMQWMTTNKLTRCTRTAFVPSIAGVLEFSATCDAKDFPELRYQLNQIMSGFLATTPDGKLEVPNISAAESRTSDAGNSQWKRRRQINFWSGFAWAAS
jgi:hypothetical protein